MKKFPQVDVSSKKLHDMILTPIYSKILLAGIELNLFSHLIEPINSETIAEMLDLHRDNTKHLLDSLVSVDLLEKKDGMYRNTDITNTFLVKGSELYLGKFFRDCSEICRYEELDIVRLVKEGPEKSSQKDTNSGVQQGDYSSMMVNYQRAGSAQQTATYVSKLPEFKNFNKMLDLGGGPGLLAMAIINEHPDMKGIIFDTPSTIKVASELIKEYELEDRIEVLGGDYMKDSIGKDYDFILASGTLNFAKNSLDSIIIKVYNALSPGGVFMCISDGLTDESTKPEEIALRQLPTRLMGCNMSFEQGVISDSMLRSGFKSVFKQTIQKDIGTMDVDIARK
ncbi:methyltransferase [Vallitalea sediminicola]